MFIRLLLTLCFGMLFLSPLGAKTGSANMSSNVTTNVTTTVTMTAQCGSLYEQATDPCSFRLEDSKFVIQANGKGVRSGNAKQIKFALNVPGRDSITVLHYGVYHGDPVFVYETEDGESTASYIVRLDAKTMRKKWETDLGGFNTATGLIHNGYLYQTAIGLVAKLDLKTGKFIWIHNNLYDRAYFSFNSFETPAKDGEHVVFKEVIQIGVEYNQPRSIVVSDADGVIRVDKPVLVK